jgi:predicted AlkP superfamily pyrophosphatase or phosphodiesterase
MFDSSFVLPRYNGACFSNIPQTIRSLFSDTLSPDLNPGLLTGISPPYDTVILFYIDAFGWRFWEEHCEKSPFLKRMKSEGLVSKITSQFPSTTSAHVTTIHSGLPVGQSGVYEWQYYEPLLDAMFSPLLFSFAGDKQRETVNKADVDLAQIFPQGTIYRRLRSDGVRSCVLQNRIYNATTYSKHLLKGSRIVSYTTFPQALVSLGQLLAQQDTPTYYFLYFDPIDMICHQFGPGSPELAAEIETFLMIMEQIFLKQLAQAHGRTLFMMTTDHGQVEVDRETTIYLNRDPQFSGIEKYLRSNRNGQLLVPAGSPRDMFLYIKEGLLDEAVTFLRNRLGPIAEVHPTTDLIAGGLFGTKTLDESFLSRVGDLVILPFANQTVWWHEKGRFEMKFRGHHGGLTASEVEIPLILYDPNGSLGGR